MASVVRLEFDAERLSDSEFGGTASHVVELGEESDDSIEIECATGRITAADWCAGPTFPGGSAKAAATSNHSAADIVLECTETDTASPDLLEVPDGNEVEAPRGACEVTAHLPRESWHDDVCEVQVDDDACDTTVQLSRGCKRSATSEVKDDAIACEMPGRRASDHVCQVVSVDGDADQQSAALDFRACTTNSICEVQVDDARDCVRVPVAPAVTVVDLESLAATEMPTGGPRRSALRKRGACAPDAAPSQAIEPPAAKQALEPPAAKKALEPPAKKVRAHEDDHDWTASTFPRSTPSNATIDDAKAFLTRQLLALDLRSDQDDIAKAPGMPQNGRFPGGAMQYAKLWADFVQRECEAQALAEVGRHRKKNVAINVELRQFENGKGKGKTQWESGIVLALQLLTGEWTGEGGKRMQIFVGESGLVLRTADGWTAGVAAPRAGNWRLASKDGRSMEVRLRDWNTLDVSGGPPSRRTPDVRPGNIMALSHAKEAQCFSLGVVERRGDMAVLRTASVKETSSLEAHFTNVSVLSSAREINAVWGIEKVPREIGREVLGRPPEVPEERQSVRERRMKLPCLGQLNDSQRSAIDAASSRDAGFSLVWGPPGTGKSSTLFSLINALHVREYERMHRCIEHIVVGNTLSRDVDAQWRAAVRCAPRILVTGSSNAAVEGLLKRVCEKKFLDRVGNEYEPWGTVRVGVARGNEPVDLDTRVQALLRLSREAVSERLQTVRTTLAKLSSTVHKRWKELQLLKESTPLPVGWEARICTEEGRMRVAFQNHNLRVATWTRPAVPPEGSPQVHVLQLPHTHKRLAELISCADRWWQLQGEEARFALLSGAHAEGGNHKALKTKLEGSFLGEAHLVFATLNSTARLLDHADHVTFGVVVIDEAAQASEPAALVPLQLAGSTRCVMVGDDRQLPPTVFSAKAEQLLLSRPLFERLRKTGHTALLLDEQYRMAPEISAFPRSHFYGGALRDAPGMLENTRRAFHAVFPPLLFFDLQSSAQRANGSWKNVLEVRMCSVIIACLKEASTEEESDVVRDVGILTPYRAQQDALRQEVRGGYNVQTVDAYQGRECEVILFSTVRAPDDSGCQGIGFLADERRFNVALTRAKSLLIVVGHAATLAQNTSWRAFLQHVRQQGCLHPLHPSDTAASLRTQLSDRFGVKKK